MKIEAAQRLRAADEEQELVVTLRGTPEVVNRVASLLYLLGWASGVGHSNHYGMFIDGDGADRLHVEGVPDQSELANVLCSYAAAVECVGDKGTGYVLNNNDTGRYLKQTRVYPEDS